MEYPLQPVVGTWLEKIKKAREFKARRFQLDADDGVRFFCGPYEFLYGPGRHKDRHFRQAFDGEEDNEIPAPKFQMTVNKVAEMVQIFGPVLYNRNPIRQVTPRKHPAVPGALMEEAQNDPQMFMQMQQLDAQAAGMREIDAARASLLEHYLNFTPVALDLKTEARWAIDEAIIKGAGCLSGGTLLYAKVNGRHTILRARDLYRVEGVAHLWDGSQWNRVVGVEQKPRKGDELKLKLRSGEEINCTTDHGWPTGRGLIRADEIVVGDKLGYVKLGEPSRPESDLLPDDIGWFVGLYLGDGHIAADKHDVEIGIAGHIDETERHERLEKFVKRYGGEISWKGREGGKNWNATIYSRVIVSILREYVVKGGAFEKHLKSNCWERSDAFLRSVLDGYLDSDGHWVEGQDVWRLGFCDNKDLANSLRIIIGRLGLRMTLKRQIQRQSGKDDMWVYRGNLRTRESKNGNQADLGEVVEISPADWRCDFYYDIAVENEPHTYCLASGLVTHNCLWTEAYSPPGGGGKMVGSFYDSVDNLVIDPDMTSLRYSKWIARRRIKPVWEVERMFELAPGSLRGNMESLNRQGEVEADPEGSYYRATGHTNDLLTYWEVYSKTGLGGRLTGSAEWIKQPLEQFGDFTYLVVCEGVKYPLNVPEALWDLPPDQSMQAIAQKVQWPTPFWADDSWPFVMISFHEVPNDPWPMSHLAPAMGELKFLNWVYSYIAGKIRVSSRDFIAILESASEELKTAIQSGSDYEIIRIKATHGKTINEIVQFLQHPQFNGDLWRVIEYVSEQFDRRTGLTELAYGISAKQYRSAAEAEAKQSATSVRPDDMANKVEDSMSLVSRQEALCTRWNLIGNDVKNVMGPVGAFLWDKLIVPSDPAEILYQLEYRIESGSARKPNKDRDRDNMQQAMQLLLPFYQNVALQTGMVAPFNALVTNWAKTVDLDPTGMLLPVPPPPPQPGPASAPGPGGPPQGPPRPAGPVPQQQGPPR